MKRTIYQRICSILLSAVIIITGMNHAAIQVVGENNPTFSFQNEKYEGIKVMKNIYSKREFVKGKGNRTPLRETNPMPGDIYDINELRYDEFTLILYGSANKDDLYKASQRPILPEIKYQRKSGSLLYYHFKEGSNSSSYEVILAPYDISEYFLYRSNGDGTINIIFSSEESYYASLHDSEDTALRALYEEYTEKTYYEKFLADGAYYSNSSDTEKKALFTHYENAESLFYTDNEGILRIFDGDITYFDKKVLDNAGVKYVRVRETWDFLRDLNAKRSEDEHAEQYTGEYVYMIDDDVLSDVISSSRSGWLEIANRFDKPVNELVVGKTVPFFGVATSDINPFRMTDTFEYKILVNDNVPARIEYNLVDTKTDITRPLETEANNSNVVFSDNEYHYVTTNGMFTMYAEQTAVFHGINNGDRVEIREYVDTDAYSVLSELSGNASFNFVKADDSTETPQRDYASITVQYGNETGQRHDPTFTNVPNVLQVRKRIQDNNVDYDESFSFTIRKLLPNPDNPDEPYIYNGQYVVNSDFVTDENGNPIIIYENGHPQTDSDGHKHYQTEQMLFTDFGYYLRDGDNNFDPHYYQSENGVFHLKHDQTAMFVNLKADTFYLVTETNIPAYQLIGSNPRVMCTRGDTVDDPLIRSKSANYYELFVNTRSEIKGIVLTKKVTNSDNRLNKDSQYTFRIEKWQNGQFIPVANTEYKYADGIGSYMTGQTNEYGYFKVGYNRDNFIVKFPDANGRYRITEVDPNDYEDQNNSTGKYAPNPEKEDHLYITDVQYTQYITDPDTGNASIDIENPVQTFNEDIETPTRDISVEMTCSAERAAELQFTNRIREKTYFFDLEKFAYLDDNVHRGESDPTHRFLFRIERFSSMENALKGISPMATFYTDLSCTRKFTKNQSNYFSDNEQYLYSFYPIDFPANAAKASAVYSNGTVTRQYTKHDTENVFGNGQQETYSFPSSIWHAKRRVAIKRRGFYKVTEIAEWSNADYDYCTGSNRYKGYFDCTYTGENHIITVGNEQTTPYDFLKNKLFADYATTHEPDYDTSRGVLENSVIICLGTSGDLSGPYTLGCEHFEQEQGNVPYIMIESTEQWIQRRDGNGTPLYYDGNGNISTDKYNSDGTRREPVPAPESDFRIQQTKNDIPLYFDTNGNEPVWKYVELSDENKDNFILENGEPQEFTVYDVHGQEIPDIKSYRLTNENNEALYLHTSHVWSYEKINHYRAENVFCPLASFSNVENEYALLSSAAWADNIIAKENN